MEAATEPTARSRDLTEMYGDLFSQGDDNGGPAAGMLTFAGLPARRKPS
jgi:hypothetical protein